GRCGGRVGPTGRAPPTPTPPWGGQTTRGGLARVGAERPGAKRPARCSSGAVLVGRGSGPAGAGALVRFSDWFGPTRAARRLLRPLGGDKQRAGGSRALGPNGLGLSDPRAVAPGPFAFAGR